MTLYFLITRRVGEITTRFRRRGRYPTHERKKMRENCWERKRENESEEVREGEINREWGRRERENSRNTNVVRRAIEF